MVRTWKDISVKGDELDRVFAAAGITVRANASAHGSLTDLELTVAGKTFRFASDYGLKLQRPAPGTKEVQRLKGTAAGLAIEEDFDDFDAAYKRKEELEPILRDGEKLNIASEFIELEVAQ